MRGLWLKIWMEVAPASAPRSTDLAGPPAAGTWAPMCIAKRAVRRTAIRVRVRAGCPHGHYPWAVRVRFAPSPTGALHIGGARTALYNWLMARGNDGTRVLRIEETDKERSTPENAEQILDELKWLQLDYDEGPISQLSRTERHTELLQRLLDEGKAYRSNATGDDVKEY